MPEPADIEAVRPLLVAARTVAVLGAHPDPVRPAHYVPAYLHARGYRILPINPTRVGQEMFGQTTVASLTDLSEPVDLVDVFRRSEAVAHHTDEILAMDPLPRVVWLQLGIRNDAVATALRARGITVVQDRCTLADHRRLRL